ncbi:MAG: homocysteine S-methyltransferase family protein [Oscillospiraceae bacterium]|nr:homocysteine S-methyltransferase family protein [Oscillospiraceae bacterium]
MQISELLSCERTLFLDGGMGTMLQKLGLAPGQRPELLALTDPELLEKVHRAYIEVGSDILYANTFGASSKKLAGTGCTVQQVVPASLACARRAAGQSGALVALDIGPLGEMLEPNGTLTFEEAYECFKEVVEAGRDSADLVVIETMTDLYEVKAALLAVKENCSLPVLVSMTFEENGRTFTGCTVQSFAAVAAGLGADAVGINCSLGPREIYPFAKALCAAAPEGMPVFVKPNAGLPHADGSGYDITPETFLEAMLPYKELGVAMVGGCCGTTPDYIRLLKASFEGRPAPRKPEKKSILCTPVKVVEVNDVTVVGERINPTGKKRFQQALREEDMDYILTQAVEQANAGAKVLDVNVGMPGVDEPALMVKVVKALQSVVDLPLQLDSSSPEALEKGLRVYNGKAIVNSVSGEEEKLAAILPLCKKYGAAVVGLTLDEKGIPAKAEDRVAIAKKIIDACLKAGIPKEDIYIDCLTLTASAQQQEVMETIKALHTCRHELGVHAALGVSNISFGLPCRPYLNTAFLTMAMMAGLDLPILNPNREEMMAAVAAYRVLSGRDEKSEEYIARYAGQTADPAPAAGHKTDLATAVLQGLKAEAGAAAAQLLKEKDPMEVVDGVLIPALDKVGDGFEKGTVFLPQLLQAAAAAQSGFEEVKKVLAKTGGETAGKGTIVIATVKGDIHDIGKNIVKVILENYGYRVLDLGKDVAPEKIVEAAKKEKAGLVGLSALMTTTLPAMEETIRRLKAAGLGCKTMVGGAVLTPDYAARIGADYYAKDAKQGADIAKEVFGG